jgi:hypothetical protein
VPVEGGPAPEENKYLHNYFNIL